MVLMFIVLYVVYEFKTIVMCASQLGLAPPVRLILGHSMPILTSILTLLYIKNQCFKALVRVRESSGLTGSGLDRDYGIPLESTAEQHQLLLIQVNSKIFYLNLNPFNQVPVY
jgi:hypothetical protein